MVTNNNLVEVTKDTVRRWWRCINIL